WMFSKLDEHTDDIFIPYHNPDKNSIEKFKPDFIFWLKKGNNYYIIFVDTKGVKYTDYEHKVDGYSRIFEKEGIKRKFNVGDSNVFVYLYLNTSDKSRVAEGYDEYWFDNIENIFKNLI
ncbi:MAG: restriction endonuclease subunit R, partial [Nanoarchaeota archaeon]